MIELHLIGYTEDGEHLVLDLEADGVGRYRLPVDPDLLATVAQLRDVRVRRGLPVDRRSGPAQADPSAAARPARVATPPARVAGAPTPPIAPRPATVPAPARRPATRTIAPEPAGSEVGTPASSGTAVPGKPESDVHASARAAAPSGSGAAPAGSGAAPAGSGAAPDAGDAAARDRPTVPEPPASRLSPAEIQALLRAGRSVRAVATDAGTDPAWVERWLPPILAERERVLADARSRCLDVPGARPLGERVDEALTERGVAADERRWSAVRRADGRWRVSVRFDDGGRARTATWSLDPDGDRLRAASPLAGELAGVARRSERRR